MTQTWFSEGFKSSKMKTDRAASGDQFAMSSNTALLVIRVTALPSGFIV